MKKLLTATACSLPLLFASNIYAQTTSSDNAPAATQDGAAGSTAPAPGAPAAGTDGAGTTAAPADRTADPAATPARNDQKETITGWSVKDKVIGETVYNEDDDKVGDVSDVVLSSDGKAAYFIVGAGGFLGMGKHDVAIPFDEIERRDDKLRLSGYTKDQLKALPEVKLQD